MTNRPIPFSQAAQRIREQKAMRECAKRGGPDAYQFLHDRQRELQDQADRHDARFAIWLVGLFAFILFLITVASWR